MNSKGNSKHTKHMVIMILCCMIPILLIMALSKFGISGNFFPFLLILLCPLAHIFMMKRMHNSNHGCNDKKDDKDYKVDNKDDKDYKADKKEL